MLSDPEFAANTGCKKSDFTQDRESQLRLNLTEWHVSNMRDCQP